MAFVPSGRKAKQKRDRAARVEKRESIIDRAIGGVRLAYPNSRLCLQTCILLERILAVVLPLPRFSLRLGSLRVYTAQSIGPIFFDPRGPDGIDGGFHAWLEDTNGQLLDPSVLVTLHAEGYVVEPASYFLMHGRQTAFDGLQLLYEALPELELLGLADSEEHLVRAMALAVAGRGHPDLLGVCRLDVGWRKSGAP